VCVTTVKNAKFIYLNIIYFNAKTGLGRHLTVQEGDDLGRSLNVQVLSVLSHRQDDIGSKRLSTFINTFFECVKL